MPKIIEDLENRLVAEAKKQVEELGYGAVTIRSVAKSCGVGVGTVYNYFPSKDALLAAYMLEGWKKCMATIQEISSAAQSPEPVMRCIYDQLLQFSKEHQRVFQDAAAVVSFAGAFSRYHAILRMQLSAPVQKFCKSAFAAEFVAESLLVWTMAGKDFAEIYALLAKILEDTVL